MADEKKTKGLDSASQGGNRTGEQSGNRDQKATFNKNDYGNDPNNMANYSGNYGTGTYDTDYGKGSFPDTDAKKQGDNWVDPVGNRQNDKNDQKGKTNREGQ